MCVDRRIRFEYAKCDGEIFESGEKKLRIQNTQIRVQGA